jgi:WD40 repeat protein
MLLGGQTFMLVYKDILWDVLCSRYVLSGSFSPDVHIYDTLYPERGAIVLEGHTDEVHGVAWSHADHDLIATCSDGRYIVYLIVQLFSD